MSLACSDGPCALPAAPRWARTAVRAVASALGQAHWSPPQASATAGRWPTVPGISHLIACAQVGRIRSPRGPPNPRGWVPRLCLPWALFVPPPFSLCGLRWWASHLSRVGWWWWGALFAFPGRVGCVRVPTSPGCGSPPLCVFVARCVRAWCLCWCVCRAFVVAWVWVCLPCVLVCVCVHVWVCGWGWLGLPAGVGVGVVGVCHGWSLATPGGGS